MISHIKQNRYKHRRLFRGEGDKKETNRTAACGNTSFKQIVPRTINEDISTHRERMNQMLQSFPDDREARTMHLANAGTYSSSYHAHASSAVDYSSTISSMILPAHEESSPTSTTFFRSDNLTQQEELSIMEVIDEILSDC